MEPLRFDSPSAIGHAYILSSSSREEALRAARSIASAAVCLAGRDVPCGNCRGCRKAAAGIHPDIIMVRRLTDKTGKLRRDLNVAQIRELSADVAVLPNEAERKVYIIEEAELMNLNAQNAALKLLEEPPSTVVFLLCTLNADLLLETVRSRCALLSLSQEESPGEDGSEQLAAGFLTALRSREPQQVSLWISKNETGRLDETSAFLEAAIRQTADMLCGRLSAGTLSNEQLMRLYRLLSLCSDYLKVNVNAKHIFSLLTVKAPELCSELENQNDRSRQH